MQEIQSFSLYLRAELNKRQRQNPQYSLRAFAANLGLSSSFLSKVLSGHKSLSEATFLKVANRLHLDEESMENYRAKLPSFKLKNLDFEAIDLDQFKHVSDWHHFAILEAVTLSDFEPSSEWIANRLGLSVDKARDSIERLIRLGYLKKLKNSEFQSNAKNITTLGSTPSDACREHEYQVLALAMKALDQTPISERDQSSLTLAIPSSRLTEARDKINQFRQEMAALLQRRGKRDAVYHLSISFYPISHPTQQQKRKPA